MQGRWAEREGEHRPGSSWSWLWFAALSTLLVAPYLSYVTDDTYIHMQFARNLMRGDGWSFVPGEPTYGFTSALWVEFLAAAGLLGVPLLFASKALGMLFTWASIGLFYAAAREIIPSYRTQLAATFAFTVNAWLLRWTLSGMETSLATALVLAGVAAHMRERRREALPILSGLCWALAAMTRPECLGLIPLAILDLLAFARARRVLRSAALAVTCAVVLLPWGLFLLSEFGQIFPNTAYAKAGHFRLDPGTVADVLRKEVGLIGATNAGEVTLVLLAIFTVWRSDRGRIRPWMERFALPAAWMLALPALYAVRGSVLVSRYLVPMLCVLVLFGFASIDYLRSRGTGPSSARAPWIAAGLFAVQNLLVLYLVALPPALSFTRGIEDSLVWIGKWARENTPAEATLAVPDIGAVGYYSERTVIDLSGLVTPVMIEAQEGQTLDEFVQSFGFARVSRPDYLIDRYTQPDRFASTGGYHGVLEMLFSRKIGPLGIRRSEDYYYTVYRIDWDRYDRLRAD
jgi:arabinofuranosyltransferase